ncbi:hypothetical protein ACFXDH_08755 [Streptomyces sp. NPDC059467]|uniref:hypothetical protein n=1 Tax=Streptomyces sp. NPDC059467 TaxID=3346844 RepID=UPI0036B96E2C
MAPEDVDWRGIIEVDLVGTALLAEALRPLATASTAFVYCASVSSLIANLAVSLGYGGC